MVSPRKRAVRKCGRRWAACWRRGFAAMAVNVLMPLLIPLGEQITNVTQLTGVGNLAFTKPSYEVFVQENTAPVLLLTLHAASNTTSMGVMYGVVAGAVGGLFTVGAYSGNLTLTAPLDYETKHMYEVILSALAGEERAFVRVGVRVLDANDQSPTFSRPLFETQITEEDDRHLPKPILQVSAVDGDVSDQGRLLYTLTGDGVATTNSSFSVSRSSGHLHLLRPLDRDQPTGRACWELNISATDGIHTASTIVNVNVKDINDNAPFFANLTINATVPENGREGSEVTTVVATDYDDPLESTNAILTYSVEKNVIDEHTGQPIFTIDAHTGRIKTALCCLDRERTPFYAIQVVASDGGGLKGTGTVLVTVSDKNDVSPKFSRPEWLLTVHESVPLNTTLAFLAVDDPDVTNNFVFRIMADSGYGWERFRLVSSDHGSGALQAIKKLDYEDPVQRQGFRFKVQVSDKEAGRWEDEEHMDSTWVVVALVDDNDNVPDLSTHRVNLTLSEDTPVGHSLATFTATDKDQGGEDEVRYTIDPSSDPFRLFAVDSVGRVHLRRQLDREAAERHVVRVLAVDSGAPALTATATILLTVTDVNDNAPNVANPDTLYVLENSGPRHVGDLKLDDADDWSLGHGPPFTVQLADDAPTHIKENFAVDFDEKGDEGRGVAVVTSLGPLDREVSVTRLLPLVLGDAHSLVTTATITITIADLNDNPMKPANKTVTITRFRSEEVPIPVGRVYVEDADDWDAGDKTWAWKRDDRHPLFTLDAHTGHLTMNAHAHDGTYELQFVVSDVSHNQRNVGANVTVTVTSVSRDVVACAVPAHVTTHSPRALITPHKLAWRSPLEALTVSVERVAGVDVGVLSLEESPVPPTSGSTGARVWFTARPRQPLDQLLLLHRRKISSESGVGVTNVGVGVCITVTSAEHTKGGSVWVVDANRTSLVTPRLEISDSGCSCHAYRPHLAHQWQVTPSADAQPSAAAVTQPASCHPNPCLNGGRCMAHTRGPRCVCPQDTSGSVCKQLSRHFRGNGWAWAAPIPVCTQAHITLELRTTRHDCLLLYAGPADDIGHSGQHLVQEDVVSLELVGGRPRVLVDLGTSPVLLEANQDHHLPSLADGHWHRLDLIITSQKVEVIVDRCQHTGECRLAAPLPPQDHALTVAAPMQVGGLAHALPHHNHHGWPTQLTQKPFHGCIRNLRVNGELRDLGEAVLGQDSWPGCPGQDPCSLAGVPCTHHARCVEVGGRWACECEPGRGGQDCTTNTFPASFSASSYVKLALSSALPPNTTSIQLRYRTWEEWGQLIAVTSQHGRDLAALHLVGGHVCLKLLLHPTALTHLCLSQVLLTDGEWHTVYVHRYGTWAELQVDEGDGPLYNATPTPATLHGWKTPLLIDRQEGVHVGGSPEYVGVSLYTVHHDFLDGCLDDLRVSGVQLPLPPLVNSSSWAQATMFTNVAAGCTAPSACTNVTCEEPFTCLDVWWRYECGCPVGSMLMRDGGACQDMDECVWSPCLNGGSCINRDPSYYCVCPASHLGDHCEVQAGSLPSLRWSIGVLVAVLVWIFILLVVVAAYLLHQWRQQHHKAPGAADTLELSSHDPDHHDHQTDVMELSVTKSVTVQTQPPLTKETKIAGVDILQQEARTGVGEGGTEGGCGCPHLPSLDDLRNYAYEGDGSSPGSLSSCCSGGDGGGDTRLMGGFQEVATLLNCLSGPQSLESPSFHETPDVSSIRTTKNHHVNTRRMSTNQLASSSDKPLSNDARPHSVHQSNSIWVDSKNLHTKNTPKKNIRISVSKTDTLETGIHNGNLYLDSRLCPGFMNNKSNSLPRSKIPTIFINNLHTESPDPGCPPQETWHNSLKKKKIPLSITSGYLGDTSEAARSSCCSHVAPLEGREELPSLLTSHGVCHSCVTVSLQLDSKMGRLYGIPRRSLSASTVSCLTDKENGACSKAVCDHHKLERQCVHPKCCLHGCYTQSSIPPVYPCPQAGSRGCTYTSCQGATFPSTRSTDYKNSHIHMFVNRNNAGKK
ncbi:putative neural-cadherin 2 isoform X2 [Homarus americanus]|uniref:putative neural-cadherin 2 isoform X2 n=1 Tax=Homarus americanus TaxID=6706 RepID=UPI001C4443FC|nr:putative neural-cadherin 2 isoform X2 [Homarus americanus]